MFFFLMLGFFGSFESDVNELIARQSRVEDMGQQVLQVAKLLLEKPYEEKTLEQEGDESLVVYVRGFDCFTLMETSLAMARTLHHQKPSSDIFLEQLQKIRYRKGQIDGYPSRLHYTCDWGFDNQSLGIVRDVTKEIGGTAYPSPVGFMTGHRKAYAAFRNEHYFQTMAQIEQEINARTYYYLPKENIGQFEAKVKDGDLLALTSKIKGLDVSHVGIAIFVEGRLHMLHASSRLKKVVITEEPLEEYLKKGKSLTGLMVFRPMAL